MSGLKTNKMQSMISLITDFTFDAGHRLSDYKGKCFALHGHTYRVYVEIEGHILNSLGMLVDFGEIKDIVKKTVMLKYDHKLMLKIGDPMNLAISQLVPKDWVVAMNNNPTAENIAKEIYTDLKLTLNLKPNKPVYKINLKKITVYETPNNAASYSEK
jgi:6-pyruvoyltetrahydropterin/6-carboxytetrahydropterin synthase